MPQTGITSAIGSAVEASWRDVPLTVNAGTLYDIGIANKAPLRFWIVEPGGGFPPAPEVVVPDNEIDGDVEPTRNMLLSMTYNGQYGFKADGENLYTPLLQMFGKDVQTQVQTIGGGVDTNMYQHLFKPNKYAPSTTIVELFGDRTYGRISSGCLVQRLSLDFSKEIMCRADYYPHRQVPNNYPNASGVLTDYTFGQTASVIPLQMSTLGDGTNTWQTPASPSYIDVQQESAGVINANSTFVFGAIKYGLAGGAFATSFFTINGVAYAIELLEGFTIDLERKIDSQMIAGSGFEPGVATGSQVFASGRFSAIFEDTTLELAALSAKKLALNFQVVGLVPGAGPQAYVLDVYIPNFRILRPEGPLVTDGPMLVGGTWKAKKDPSLGYGIQIKLINTYDATQLGGCYPLSSTITAPTAVGTAVATFANAKNIVKGDIHTFYESTVNGGTPVSKTVLSVNYTTNVVTYTTNVGFIFPFATTTITRNRVGGLGGWSNA